MEVGEVLTMDRHDDPRATRNVVVQRSDALRAAICRLVLVESMIARDRAARSRALPDGKNTYVRTSLPSR